MRVPAGLGIICFPPRRGGEMLTAGRLATPEHPSPLIPAHPDQTRPKDLA
ncbi:hypothetical protein IMCC26256_112053 [Actinobacteria bacterium IMCC26256]|nr:hypothetical protein IMCC26256_112053 [Actinobacteria bacterium IMCC26256]